MCDQCTSGKEELIVAARRPSDPLELCSVLYLCKECTNEYRTTVDGIVVDLKSEIYCTATNEAWKEFSDKIEDGEHFGLNPRISFVTL